MIVSLRHKLTLILLFIYWPVIFTLSHIPVPGLVREAGVSDKTLHFLVYLLLTFLFWFAVSPERKVNYRRVSLWWVFLVMAGYAIIDEVLQGYVGRNADMLDFVADVAGILAGLIMLTIFSFWPALLIVTGASIFLLSNVSKVSPADLLPVANAVFHLAGYSIFTLLWIVNMQAFLSNKTSRVKWVISAAAVPMCFLLFVKFFSLFYGKVLVASDVILAIGGIVVCVAAGFIALFCRREISR